MAWKTKMCRDPDNFQMLERKDTSYWGQDKTVILWQSENVFFSEIFQQCRALEHIFWVQNKVTSNIQWSMSNLTLKGTREVCQRDQENVSKGPGKCGGTYHSVKHL
jgi:hypothetical protein